MAQADAVAQQAGEAQESGVLARAVVVQRGRLAPGGGDRAGDRLDARPVGAALERACVEAGLGEHARDHGDVLGLAVVRRAGDRELLVVELEALRGAALDQRNRLQHLDRRARKDQPLDVAERDDPMAVGVDDDDRAAMRRFARVASRRLDQDRVHARSAVCIREL